jgi:hypothetical protein
MGNTASNFIKTIFSSTPNPCYVFWAYDPKESNLYFVIEREIDNNFKSKKHTEMREMGYMVDDRLIYIEDVKTDIVFGLPPGFDQYQEWNQTPPTSKVMVTISDPLEIQDWAKDGTPHPFDFRCNAQYFHLPDLLLSE